ncbi:MAG: hypothetical protein K8R90_05125 [Candidatus Cloacimonetes bacterium]|nr:hypothetical protein [Candidatus Cloacimonadota bacterium]
MAEDKRLNEIVTIKTSIDPKDYMVGDKGPGSSSTNNTFIVLYSILAAWLADLAQTLKNKTLQSPTITTGMTVDFDTKVTNLNADRVDSCNVGSVEGAIPQLADGADDGKLDTGWLGKAATGFMRFITGYAQSKTEHATGTLNLRIEDAGAVVVKATGACTINLPDDAGEANIGAPFFIAHPSGVFAVTVNAASGDKINMLKDDLTSAEGATATLTNVGSTLHVRWDGGSRWLIESGYGFSL